MSTSDDLTASEAVAEAQRQWDAPREEARKLRAEALAYQRQAMNMQLVILTNAVTTAFQHGDHTILTASEEECLRLLDLIRAARGRR